MLAALLALAASFTWGTSNYLAGVETRTRSVWHVTALSQIAAAAAAAIGLVAATQPPPGGWDLFLLIVTGIATAAGLVMFYKALAIGTMSVVSPIIAAQVLIPVTAGILLGERPGPQAYVGMVVTIAGVVLISRTPRKEKKDRTEAHHRAARKAVLLAVLTAVAWGFMLLIYGTTGKENPMWAVFDTRLTSAVVLAGYVLLTGRGLSLKSQNVPVLAAIGILLAVANFLFIIATRMGYLSVTSILASLSPVVVTAYAQVLLHERLAPRQWAGFLAVFAGIAAVRVTPAIRRGRRVRRGAASGLRAALLELLALLGAEDVLAHAHDLGRHLDQLVVGDPLQRALESDEARHLEAGVDVLGGRPVVAELLALGGVAEHVVAPRVLADDHALVDRGHVADEECGALLQVLQRVARGLTAGLADERAALAAGQSPFHGP